MREIVNVQSRLEEVLISSWHTDSSVNPGHTDPWVLGIKSQQTEARAYNPLVCMSKIISGTFV